MRSGRKESSVTIDADMLRNKLRRKNIKIKELARAIEYSEVTVKKSIRERRMDIMLVAAVCKYLHIEPAELVVSDEPWFIRGGV